MHGYEWVCAHGQGDVIGLAGGECHFELKFAGPYDGTVGIADDETHTG